MDTMKNSKSSLSILHIYDCNARHNTLYEHDISNAQEKKIHVYAEQFIASKTLSTWIKKKSTTQMWYSYTMILI